MPLATYLGATLDPIPAYNSNGLGLMSPEAAADEAEALFGRRLYGRQASAGAQRLRR